MYNGNITFGMQCFHTDPLDRVRDYNAHIISTIITDVRIPIRNNVVDECVNSINSIIYYYSPLDSHVEDAYKVIRDIQ